jgi:Rrf2 family protein
MEAGGGQPDMLCLTKKTDYALIALAYLAQRQSEEARPVSARAIAEQFDLPLPLLMNVLKELAQARLVRSTRGAHGGYALALAPGQVSLLDVVHAIEGPIRLAPCATHLHVAGEQCLHSADCPIRSPVQKLHARLSQLFDGITLADLLEDRVDGAADWRPAKLPAV